MVERIDFSALQTPDYFGNSLKALQQGRQDQAVLAKQNALKAYAVNPDEGIRQLMSVDPASAVTLQKAQAEQRQQASAEAAGRVAATGDLTGAARVAGNAGNIDLMAKFQAMTKEQRTEAASAFGELASAVFPLKKLPYEQRKAALAGQAPRLQQLGLSADQISGFDPTDENIDSTVGTALGAKGQAEQANQDRTFKLQTDQAAETVRSHQATEAQQAATLKETAGYHQGQLGIDRAKLGVEQARLKLDQSKGADGDIDPATIKAMAEQAWAGDKSVFSNLGRGVQGSRNIAALRKEIYAQGALNGKTPAQLAQMNAQFMGDTAAARTAGTRVGAATVSTEELPGLIQQSSEAYSKLPRTQFKPFNQLQQAVMNNTASPEQAAAYAADFAVVNAYARAVSPTGQPHVADQKKGADLLSHVSGPDEHEAVLKQIIKETAVIKAGAQRALHPDSGAPSAPDAAPQRLSPAQAMKLAPGTKFVGMDGVERVRH